MGEPAWMKAVEAAQVRVAQIWEELLSTTEAWAAVVHADQVADRVTATQVRTAAVVQAQLSVLGSPSSSNPPLNRRPDGVRPRTSCAGRAAGPGV